VKFDLIGVPYTSMAKPGGIGRAIEILRELGLAESVALRGDVRDAGDLELVEGSGVRGPSGLLNERALGHLVAATREAVSDSLDRRRLPLVIGGDCPVLLGALAAGRDRYGEAGLLFIDGHEDAWPPKRSPTGEASDSELAIALGRIGDLPEPLDRLVPLLAPEALAMLGPRDRHEIEQAGADSLEDTAALLRDDETVRANGAETSAREAIWTLAATGLAFWLHIDLDVLRTRDFPAADYPQPGGLAWDELLEIATRTLAAPDCFGCSVVIYNPELDPERTSAARLVHFVSDLVGAEAFEREHCRGRRTSPPPDGGPA
jgi:arginase